MQLQKQSKTVKKKTSDEGLEGPHKKERETERGESQMSSEIDAWRTPIKMAAQERGHRERRDEGGIKIFEAKGF